MLSYVWVSISNITYTGCLPVLGDSLFSVTGARNVTLLNPVLYPFQMIYKITITRIHTYTCKNSLIASAVYICMCVCVGLCQSCSTSVCISACVSLIWRINNSQCVFCHPPQLVVLRHSFSHSNECR